MIKPEDRFWISSTEIFGNTTTSVVVDWDQRRMFAVAGPTILFPDGEDVEIEILKRYIDQIDRSVLKLTVDEHGALISTSSDPEDDPTFALNYPRYSDVPSLADYSTIALSKLTEIDRLGPNVDLMICPDESGGEKKVVFKYSIIFQRIRNMWNELHIIKTLRQHPNLVPFHRVVIDDAESRVLGFTTPFFAGGTLDDNRSRVFRFSWLQQLTAVVDYLNLEQGIIHQDVAPRNLLVDSDDNLRLFDFDRAAHVGQPGIVAARNDVAGVVFTVYEIITHDDEFRRVDFEQQDPNVVFNLKHWPINTQLDTDLSIFRKHLNNWVQQRRVQQPMTHVQTRRVPDMPTPRPVITSYDESGKPVCESLIVQLRVDALKFNQHVVSWERPPYQEVYPNGAEI